MSRKDKYNSSGCLDMTAYLALRNVEKEEKQNIAARKSQSLVNEAQNKQTRCVVNLGCGAKNKYHR